MTETGPSADGVTELQKSLLAATGSLQPDLSLRLVEQAEAVAAPRDGAHSREGEKHSSAVVESMKAIAPRDPIEGMLAAQMVTTHNTALELLRKAGVRHQHRLVADLCLRSAGKLMNLYLRQAEALDRRRGRHPPNVTVGQVQVHDGGQAIVGHVETKRG